MSLFHSILLAFLRFPHDDSTLNISCDLLWL